MYIMNYSKYIFFVNIEFYEFAEESYKCLYYIVNYIVR